MEYIPELKQVYYADKGSNILKVKAKVPLSSIWGSLALGRNPFRTLHGKLRVLLFPRYTKRLL